MDSQPKPSIRLDEFVNAVAGMGDPGRDKSPSTRFVADYVLRRGDINDLYKSNWLSKRICNVPATDATADWWKLKELSQDELVQAEVKRLGARRAVLKALVWCALYGESAVLMDEDTPAASDAPIESAQLITSLTVVAGGKGSTELTIDRDEMGRPIRFNYWPRNRKSQGRVYDPSRVLYLRYDDLPSELLEANAGCSYSALQNAWHAVKRYGVAMQSGENFAYERSFIHYKVKGVVHSAGLSNVADTFEDVMRRLMLAKGVYRAIVTGKDDELQAFNANFTGWGDFINLLMYEVSGAVDIPVTRLFGMSPGGMNATGEFDDKNYRQRIKNKEQEGILRPVLEQFVEALMWQAQGPWRGRQQPFELLFNPLEVPTAEEQEAVATSRFNRILGAVREGVVLASEVREALFPEDNEDGVNLDATAFDAEQSRSQALADIIGANAAQADEDLDTEETEE